MISQKEFIEKVQKRARFRQKYLRRILFYFSKIRGFDHTVYLGKPKSNFIYLTICNKESFPMVRASIFSFLKNSKLLPQKVVIISDGTWDAKVGEKCFSDFKISFDFDSWLNCAEYFKVKNQENLYKWANKQIWGKKMAAILKYSESSLVLFSDPDILWYGNPISTDDFNKESLLKLSIDNSHNYDERMIAKMKAEYLYDLSPINCGVVLIKGDMFKLSKTISASIAIEATEPGNFSEQTVFALMASEFGEVFSEDEVTASIADILSPVLRKSEYDSQLVGRHYLWQLKWIYWRDLLTNV